MPWSVGTLNPTVDAEIEALPADMRARLSRLSQLIEKHDLQALPRGSVDHLEGKLWEMRMKGRDGIARSLYVTATGKRVVVLRSFVKKTQKTPRREIELALDRAKELK